MAKFRIDPASLAKIQGKLADYQKATEKRLLFALDNWALDVVAEMSREIEAIKAIDQGILHAATTKTPAEKFGTVLRVTVFNPIEYAVIVEFGRMAGGRQPPPDVLIGWAVRHGMTAVLSVNSTVEEYPDQWKQSGFIVRNMAKGGGGDGKKKPLDPITLDFLTIRLIAKKIADEGIAGRHPFSIAWDRKKATFRQDIAALAGTAV